MLSTVKHLRNYAIHTTDGAIGHVRDVYFDDHSWVVRYLVVETSGLRPVRKVLISPISVTSVDAMKRVLTLSITRQQVEDSPGIDTDKPLSRGHERSVLGYYGYPYYWDAEGLRGTGSFSSALLNMSERGMATPPHGAADIERAQEIQEAGLGSDADIHLHSCREVAGYRIEAADGRMGQVAGFLLEESTWAIRYLVVNTSKWWSDHDVLVAVQWISNVRWLDNTVTVALTCQAVKDSPAYDPERAMGREQEAALFEHYGRDAYWDD
ncbi:MAG: PRC-barrel domain-containing protein [Rhodanobacter sp.]